MPASPLAARPEPLLSVQQAAEYLGVTVKTIRRYADSGRLRVHRLGDRMIRVRRDDLDALLTPVEH